MVALATRSALKTAMALTPSRSGLSQCPEQRI